MYEVEEVHFATSHILLHVNIETECSLWRCYFLFPMTSYRTMIQTEYKPNVLILHCAQLCQCKEMHMYMFWEKESERERDWGHSPPPHCTMSEVKCGQRVFFSQNNEQKFPDFLTIGIWSPQGTWWHSVAWYTVLVIGVWLLCWHCVPEKVFVLCYNNGVDP